MVRGKDKIRLGQKNPCSKSKEFEPNVVDSSFQSFKLVPWMSWGEWKLIRDSIFSSSLDCVAFALQIISRWRSRGCIHVAVDVTASIVEIQQKDPFFRLVNGVLEKTRKKNLTSIGEAADAIDIPRMLIDIRHEGSHHDLPSLQLVRLASTKALEWLILYYWEPQEKEIPVQNNKTAHLRKEIKRSLRVVSLCVKAKQMENLSSSHDKGKRVRQTDLLCGRSKFLLSGAGKSSHSKSTGSKKQLAKALKNTLRLYSSFSTEVVYLLLEYLLNALEASNLTTEHAEDTAFDDWKTVVLKLSRKEPELRLIFTQAVLKKMETNEIINCKAGENQFPVNSANARRFESLSYLFEWVVGNLKTLGLVGSKDSAEAKGSNIEKHLSRATLVGLLRRCLLVSLPGNERLMASAITLAQLTGGSSLMQKLKKLALLPQPSVSEENTVISYYDESFLSKQEHSIRQAEANLELIKQQMQSKRGKLNLTKVGGTKSRWAVSKSWNPCPIGMLPHTIGFSGRLPTLDCVDNHKEPATVSGIKEVSKQSHGKRESDISTEKMDTTRVKKVAIEADHSMDSTAEGIKGHLMIDGVWKKVGEQELSAIASAVKLLI